jgi:hypothetical protein
MQAAAAVARQLVRPRLACMIHESPPPEAWHPISASYTRFRCMPGASQVQWNGLAACCRALLCVRLARQQQRHTSTPGKPEQRQPNVASRVLFIHGMNSLQPASCSCRCRLLFLFALFLFQPRREAPLDADTDANIGGGGRGCSQALAAAFHHSPRLRTCLFSGRARKAPNNLLLFFRCHKLAASDLLYGTHTLGPRMCGPTPRTLERNPLILLVGTAPLATGRRPLEIKSTQVQVRRGVVR